MASNDRKLNDQNVLFNSVADVSVEVLLEGFGNRG